jgi:hypothetical protein
MARIARPKVDLDLRPYFKGEERGHSVKELIVCHETVSYNAPGIVDEKNVAAYMDKVGLEIHGIIDAEAHSAWCYDATAIYDHAASGSGNVNTRGIGFELVSEIPMLKPGLRFDAWRRRRKQLNKLAEWCAYLHVAEGIPLRYSDGRRAGITTHWSVSKTFLGGHGHWDCWPKHVGGLGYFPVMYVVRKAQQLLEDGS